MWSGFVDLPGTSGELVRAASGAAPPRRCSPASPNRSSPSRSTPPSRRTPPASAPSAPRCSSRSWSSTHARRHVRGDLRLVAAAALLYPVVLATASGWRPVHGPGARSLSWRSALPSSRCWRSRPSIRGARDRAGGDRPGPLGPHQPAEAVARAERRRPARRLPGPDHATGDHPARDGQRDQGRERTGSDRRRRSASPGRRTRGTTRSSVPRLERRVVRMDPKTVTRETMGEAGVGAVLFANAGKPPLALGAGGDGAGLLPGGPVRRPVSRG